MTAPTLDETRPDRPVAAEPAPVPTGDRPPRPWWWVAGPGLAVGLASAFAGLDRKSFWLDEAYTLGAVAQLGRTLRETGGTMALYYPVVAAWSRLSDSVWWMRSLTVLTAAVALVVVGRLAARTVGDRRARLAVLLTALSYLWLMYAREARSYGLVMLLSALSWLALDHAVADGEPAARRRWWAVHTAVAVLLPLAHGLALLQVVPQAVVLLAARSDRGAWARLARGLVAGAVVTGALLTLGAGDVGTHVPPLSALQVGIVVNEMTSPFPAGAALLLVVIGIGVAQRLGEARTAGDAVARARAVAPVAWALGPPLLLVVLSVARPALVSRYLVGIVPAVALLLVAAVDRADVRLPRARHLAAGALVAVLVAGQLQYHLGDPHDGWQAVTEEIADRAGDGDALLFATEATRPPFEAAWRGIDAPPALDVVGDPRPLGRVLRFEADEARDDDRRWAAAAGSGAGRLWVVGNPTTGDRFTIGDLTEGTAPTHREVGRWRVDPGGLTVVLLVPRDDAGR